MGDIIKIARDVDASGHTTKRKGGALICKVYHYLFGGIMPHKDPQKAHEYWKKYYAEHREKNNIDCKKYREENKEKLQAYAFEHRDKKLERNRQIREEVLSHYGGKCVVCGDSNPNHLSIDHINNDGAEHRRTTGLNGGGLYRWLIKNKFPDTFQLLCHTHNFEKGRYGVTTPMEFNNE